MISPNSRIIILKTPMELNDKNQLTFSNSTSQYNYFYSLPKVELDNATFQRKDDVIRFETDSDFTYDDVLLYNYCMYQNTSYGNKWFYAYITDVIYKSDGMSELKIKTDVYQTWQFNVTWKKSFVEREHIATSSDTIGTNTIPENLETGDYIVEDTISSNFTSSHLVMASTISVANGNASGGIIRDGLYSGLNYTLFKTYSDLTNCIKQIDEWGKAESIQSIFYALDDLTDYNNVSWTSHTGDYNYDYAGLQNGLDTASYIKEISTSIISSFGDYVPKNNKLFTYPYCFINVTNNVGNNAIYYFENFNNINSIKFNIWGVLCQGGSIISYPVNYNNGYWDAGIMLGKLPVCSWSSDTYTNWLTQNAVNIPLSIGTSALTALTGAISGNVITATSGLLGITQTIGSIYEHSLIPPQANGNSNGGDVLFAIANAMNFNYQRKRIKSQYAKIIDEYFSMFGYKTNRVKVPNMNNRSNWNFIKTIDCNVIGDIPQNDLEEYRKLFDDGITLWHNASTFLDYSQTNS